MTEWLAGWITKPANLGSISDWVLAEISTSNSALGDYSIEHSENRIIAQFGLSDNEIRPGMFQLNVQ